MSLAKIYLYLYRFWGRHSKLITMILIIVAAIIAFWLRSQQYFNVIKSVGAVYPEARLDELDTFINYWIVDYMDRHGFLSFFSLSEENPATCLFWYPECRNLYASELPGHIFTIYFLYQVVKPLNVSLYDLMAFIPPLLGALGTIFTALAVKELTKNDLASITSAFIYALMFLSREVAGFTVKYTFGLFTAPLVLWLHTRVVKKPSIVNAIIASIALAYAASVWTGVGLTAIPILITLILTPLALELNSIESFKRHSMVYAAEIAIPIAVMVLMPPYRGGRMVIWLALLIAFVMYALGSSLRVFLGKKRGIRIYLTLFVAFVVSGAAILYLMSIYPELRYQITKIIPMAGKILLGLGVNPGGVAETVAQYQPGFMRIGEWHMLILLMLLIFLVIPIAIYDIVRYKSVIALATAIWSFLAWYATYNTAYFDDYTKVALSITVGLVIGRLLMVSAPNIKAVGKVVKISMGFEKIIALLLTIFIAIPTIYVAYGSSRVYSYKYTMLSQAEGFYRPTDVWIKALDFIRRNTSENALVVSWWDYGYWLSVIGNRSTLADGATINSEKIHRLAQFFTYSYNNTYMYLKEFGACRKDDVYVVIFGPVDVHVSTDTRTLHIAFPVAPEGFGDIPKFINAIVYLATGKKGDEGLRHNRSQYQFRFYTNEWIINTTIVIGFREEITTFVALNIESSTLLNATLPRLFMWSVGEALRKIYPNFSQVIVPSLLGVDEIGRIVVYLNPTMFGYSLDPSVLSQDLYEVAYISVSQPIELLSNVYRYVFVSILKLKNSVLETLCR